MEIVSQLNQIFEELIVPTNFIKNFKEESDFKEWCEMGTVEDLLCTLERFKEYEELYEYCAIIVNIIKEKQNGTRKRHI